MTFWETIWLTLNIFFFVAYLMILFQVITDLFRDREMSGVGKAVWMIFLVFLPLVTAIVYLVARGRGMAERSRAAAVGATLRTEEYIREVAGKLPAEEISRAKSLLDGGVITPDEFLLIKRRALA